MKNIYKRINSLSKEKPFSLSKKVCFFMDFYKFDIRMNRYIFNKDKNPCFNISINNSVYFFIVSNVFVHTNKQKKIKTLKIYYNNRHYTIY